MSARPTKKEMLQAIYGENFPGHLVLWNRQDKQTKFFLADQLDELVATVETHPQRDWYVALGTQRQRLQPLKRGKADGVVFVPGFVADIDFVKPDKPRQYPADEAEALRIIEAFPLKPSAIIRTGGGLHAHWFLDRGIAIERPRDRDKAKSLVQGFQLALIEHFKTHGREIDNVGDLARVFRIPGTLNHKTTPPRQVGLIVFEPSRRISVADVEALLEKLDIPFERGGSAKEPTTHKETFDADHEAIRKECAWYRDVTGEGSAACDEPNWYAAASITARCENGDAIFHDYSQGHAKYSRQEAEAKLERARTEAGPRTCEKIADLGNSEICVACPHRGKIKSPIQLGRRKSSVTVRYEPDNIGPVPLGYHQQEFIFRHQSTRQIARLSAMQLVQRANLFGLAPKWFWEAKFGITMDNGKVRIDVETTADALIQACRAKGAISGSNFRGMGLWREGERLVPNFTDALIESSEYLYVPPRQKVDLRREAFEIERIREFLQRASWAVANAGDLVLGWCMIAPLAGALEWRPHMAITGAAQSGKSTIIKGVSNLLRPLALTIEGNSTEAGVRQSIGSDARPVIIDEFETESSQDAARVGRIVRLMRSTSSATGETARGTPEGKPLQFNLRAIFIVGAINLYRVSAADTSRIIRLELKAHTSDQNSRRRIIELQENLAQVAPAFCQFAIDQAENTLVSIGVLHRHMHAIQARQADNMAAVLAGLWVALHERAITSDEAPEFLATYDALIREHGEATSANDAYECLEALLTHSVSIGQGSLQTLGSVLAEALVDVAKPGRNRHIHYDLLAVNGIKLEDGGFVVANSHAGVTKIFQASRWAGGQWAQALARLPGARKARQKRFGDARSLGTWIPRDLVDGSADAVGTKEQGAASI